jgi:hypothetical protein
MYDKFPEAEHLRIAPGSFVGMNYIVEVSKPDVFAPNTHFVYGSLKQVDNQFFTNILPEIAPGSYLQIRQDIESGEVDAEIIIPGRKGIPIKNGPWHHQPKNNVPLYFTSFQIGSTIIQLAIGSKVTEKDLFDFFEKKSQ